MGGDAKIRYFQFLVHLGYKEIEISYPSASQTEYDFTRHLSTTPGLVPDDVWIQVMAPCREELIRRTVESVRGCKKVIVHLHVSTSECFRRIVFNKTEKEMVDLAVRCTRLLRRLTKDSPDFEVRKTEWTYEFTPENFQDTSLDFAVQICEAVKAAWEPTVQNQVIFNLPSTVEVAMPNVFADQIERFCAGITEREKVCVSLHTHNDRGCAVAAAEMAQLAGADRVEGCLFGNGERTGNVDLVTLALNLHTQGVDPGINFGDINQVVTMVEELTKIRVHPRAPYAGNYVFCTFTGTHQDAIRKGYKHRQLTSKSGEVRKWEMPYLPMDPEDIGRKHEAIIRVNSQSGKSGIAWLVKEVLGIEMPPELELAFTRVVQDHTTATGLEVTPSMIENLFKTNYMLVDATGIGLLSYSIENAELDSAQPPNGSYAITNWNATNENTANGKASNGSATKREFPDGHCHKKRSKKKVNGNAVVEESSVSIKATVTVQRVHHEIQGSGSQIISSITNAVKSLGFDFEVVGHTTQLVGSEPDSCVSFVKLASGKQSISWGVAIHEDPIWASMQAVSPQPNMKDHKQP